jgi:hypothetical protein
VVRSVSGLRVLAPPRLAEHSGAMAVRTRLHLSERDERVVAELGEFLGELASRDLAERILLGAEHTAKDFARRKRELTALSSSRWAGTLTRGSNDQWALARRAQAAHLAELEQAIATVSARLSVPVGACLNWVTPTPTDPTTLETSQPRTGGRRSTLMGWARFHQSVGVTPTARTATWIPFRPGTGLGS